MIGHPLVRSWVRRHPDHEFEQSANAPAVRRLLDELDLGPVTCVLSGEDHLNLLVGAGRLVLRSYKPFVTRPRILDLQRIRAGLAVQGLRVTVPIMIGGRSVFRCGTRWAEVEPYLDHQAGHGTPEELFAAIGRLHRALRRLPPPTTRDLRPAYVDPDLLGRWLRRNAADGATSDPDELAPMIKELGRRWIPAEEVQTIHGDPHGANLVRTDDGPVYFDFGGLATAPRAWDLAVAHAYLLRTLQAPDPAGLYDAYEGAAASALTPGERSALRVYPAAAALMYAICGWGEGWRRIARDQLTGDHQ
ncbi:phosphotransferase enzyme family protein [Microlunatus parietis]|uniref:Ser/Thr protein kinase RdoA (MazF antagonist) n=1 Tax=Microlunatus parietis TaxID=682979 RepID=A0A7Y9LDY6_9ACTN|nr:phosphotransferase [Microlunatus parietis]NYE72481.1 Ser/Thr protein kinase RdoA (MazF antagonist) [Microlunatus parietis]